MKVRSAGERGRTDWGGLDSRYTFSFGEYYDPALLGFRALGAGERRSFALRPERHAWIHVARGEVWADLRVSRGRRGVRQRRA